MVVLKVGTQWYEICVHEETDAKPLSNKDFAKKEKSGVKQVITAFAKAFDPTRNKRAYDKAKRDYKKAKEEFKSTLETHLSQYLAGEITHTQFSYRVKKDMTDMYERAFVIGQQSTGLQMDLDSTDKKFLDKFKKEEYKYLNKFIDDMQKSKGSMDYQDRLNMYVDTVDSMFEAGRVDAHPDQGTKVYWIMGASEHCDDCKRLASESPYTPESLPTTPRAGHTRCLSRCKCSLRIRYDHPGNVNLAMRKVSSTRAKEIMGEAYDWNVIDDVKTTDLMIKSQHFLDKGNVTEHVNLIRTNVEYLNRLHEDLDISSQEFDVLHAIGDWVLSQTMQM